MSEFDTRAAVDALLLAQARWRGDHTAERIITAHMSPYAVAGQLAQWLQTAVRKAIECGAGPEFGDVDEFDVIARWIHDVQTPREEAMTDQIGQQYPQPDPRGWLVFAHLPDELQRAEDSTQTADYLRADGNSVKMRFDTAVRIWYFERDATDAERTLLSHLGYTLPDTLKTRVDFATETLRRRTWPQLDTQEVTP